MILEPSVGGRAGQWGRGALKKLWVPEGVLPRVPADSPTHLPQQAQRRAVRCRHTHRRRTVRTLDSDEDDVGVEGGEAVLRVQGGLHCVLPRRARYGVVDQALLQVHAAHDEGKGAADSDMQNVGEGELLDGGERAC